MQVTNDRHWHDMRCADRGSPEAFEGAFEPAAVRGRGRDRVLVSSVEDAIRTMAAVEACYESSARGGTPIRSGQP
jgi:hypothetical protein